MRVLEGVKSKVHRARSAGGNGEVFRRALGRVRGVFRKSGHHPLRELLGLDVEVHVHASDAIRAIARLLDTPSPSDDMLALWRVEIDDQSRSAVTPPPGVFDGEYDLGLESTYLLGSLVRWLAPTRVIETGVARGRSTETILKALAQNGQGRLYSFDVTDQVGQLVSGRPSNWRLSVLPPRPHTRSEFTRQIEALAPADLFLHDSDHSYSQQSFEFFSSTKVLSPDGLLVSDDVDASMAFLDFIRVCNLRAVLLVDDRKVLGVVAPSARRASA